MVRRQEWKRPVSLRLLLPNQCYCYHEKVQFPEKAFWKPNLCFAYQTKRVEDELNKKIWVQILQHDIKKKWRIYSFYRFFDCSIHDTILYIYMETCSSTPTVTSKNGFAVRYCVLTKKRMENRPPALSPRNNAHFQVHLISSFEVLKYFYYPTKSIY